MDITRDEMYKQILNTKNQTKEEARESMRRLYRKQFKNTDATFIMVTDDEINAKDYTQVHAFFKKLERQWRAYKGKVMLVVDGYDDVPEELYEIPSVLEYFRNLFTEYPHYMYYLSELTESFQLAILFLASGIEKDAKTDTTFVERLESFNGDYDAFDKEMEKLWLDVKAEIKNSTFETLSMNLVQWFSDKYEVGEAYEILNKLKQFNVQE